MINTYSKYSSEKSIRRWRDRTPIIGIFLGLAGVVIIGKLFYIQVIQHEAYKNAATAEQLRKLTIPAERGTISMLSGDKEIPIVLNETKYLIFADPSFIKDPKKTATLLHPLLGGELNDLEDKLSINSRYVELKKKLDEDTKNKIAKLKLPGIVAKKHRFRTYPEATLAAQTLGFVNYDGDGQYGVEGYLNEELAGTPGQLKAITDVHGVPLAGNSENIVKQPIEGQDITLTIDTTIQRIAEEAIKNGVEKTKSPNGGVVIMDINTGAVKAIANWPSYDPSAYEKVTDQNLYKNRSITDPLEVASIMKLMTISAGIDTGVITKDTTYQDLGYQEVDGLRIKNALSYGVRTFSMFDVIKYSLNTGVIQVLKEMGGGEVNEKARVLWHNYLVDHYNFGKLTGVEQSGEGRGIVPDPKEGYGLNVQYANTTFGQGISVTIMQCAAALSSVINGGTYYKPSLVHSMTDSEGVKTINTSKVVTTNVVTAATSADMVSLMERYAKENNPESARTGFSIGGKTGTAEIPSPNGGYYDDKFNGTYAGFIGGRTPQYAIVIRVDEPKISGSAGAIAARPVFTEIAKGMMDTLPFSRDL